MILHKAPPILKLEKRILQSFSKRIQKSVNGAYSRVFIKVQDQPEGDTCLDGYNHPSAKCLICDSENIPEMGLQVGLKVEMF